MDTETTPFPGDELQAAYEARDSITARTLLREGNSSWDSSTIAHLLQNGDEPYLLWLLDCGLEPHLEECYQATLLGRRTTPRLVCRLLERGANPYRDEAKEELWPGVQELLLQCDALPEAQKARCLLREEWGYKDVP